jgi:DNA-binding MarR family transcriptional regulator
MAAIASAPGVSQVDLVRATGVDRSTLADLIKRLEKRGLVWRTPSPHDARAHAVQLTEEGVTTLAAARHHARAADAAILDALPRTKRKAFVAILERLSAHADKLTKKAEREAKRDAKKQAKLRARAKPRRKKRKPATETRKSKRRSGAR